MKEFHRKFERFCYRNQKKGIPNLMLFVILGNLVVYLFAQMDPSNQLLSFLVFDRSAIFSGQVWRLLTYIFIPDTSNLFFFAIMLFFYYQIGKILENRWGTFRFNLYYFTGIILTDIAALVLNAYASAYYLNLSLILAFATSCPENKVLLFYIIPIKMKYLAWFYFISLASTLLSASFAEQIFIVASLANYGLFMGTEIKNLFVSPGYRPKPKPQNKPNPNWAAGYKPKPEAKPYRHKCTVCGRTDTDFPDLEFRYCSQCQGYHCYCMDHINNHSHVQ